MIHGVVSPDREAVVRLRVRGANGREQDVEAVIDTGFNGFLTLPPTAIADLQLVFMCSVEGTLGDGSEANFSLHEGIVVWGGQERPVDILEAEGGPLLGMSLLYGFDPHVQVVEGGMVAITPLG